jgi:lipid-binding SYLF domain-containing protein
MKIMKLAVIAVTSVYFLSGCMLMSSRTPQEKREYVLSMKDSVLQQLYRTKPHARGQVKRSVGYAVFSNANVNVILASFSGGYGVVTDNRNGRHTYMRMGEVGLGLGLGVKDFRAVIIFHNRRTMRHFVERGWQFGGHVDAAAKASDKGGAISGEAMVGGMTIYQLTKSGLALQATLKGTKFWRDPELNNY